MTDTTAPAPFPILDVLKAYAPSLGQCLVLVTGLAVGAATTFWLKPKPHLVIDAADKPRPGPVDAITPYNDVIREHCSAINGKLDAVLERLPAKRGAK